MLNRIDPMTYAVDPLRKLVFPHLSISPAAQKAPNPGVTWWSYHTPAGLEVLVVAALGLLVTGIAIWQFRRTE